VLNATPAARRLDAEELVHSIRMGMEARDPRFQSPTATDDEPPPDENPLLVLAPVAGLLEVPARAKAGPLRRPIAFARRILRALLRPWTELQTRHNRLAAQLMVQQERRLRTRFQTEIGLLRRQQDELRRQLFELNRRAAELEARAERGE
jgi:hypothetical protein